MTNTPYIGLRLLANQHLTASLNAEYRGKPVKERIEAAAVIPPPMEFKKNWWRKQVWREQREALVEELKRWPT